ncbi:MAG: hypothetical protein WBQ50_19480 [Nocardioides sp.]
MRGVGLGREIGTAKDASSLVTALHQARDLFRDSTIARAVFGDEVVEHYVHFADVEIEAFDAAVTDWELRRGFERL